MLINHARPRGLFLYERHTLAANSNWIGVSQYVMQLTHSIFHLAPHRARIIYNFLPTTPPGQPEIPDLPSDFILYAGLVCHRKGAPLLAEAVRDILKRYPALHLVYVGGMFNHEGRPVSEIIREILGPQLTNRVHFLGHLGRDATLACMRRAKLLAFPSKLESFGLVVIEAMSCGIPVVYTKDPPGPEIIDDGITGLLADPHSAEDFRAKIETLLNDPDLCSRLGRNAQQTVATRFSLTECVSSTENFYRECLELVS
jgi:glycosyltransferase involved in cell wall biosynthesis